MRPPRHAPRSRCASRPYRCAASGPAARTVVPQQSRAANGTHRGYRSGATRRAVQLTCTAAVPPGERYAPRVPQRCGGGPAARIASPAAVPRGERYAPRAPQRSRAVNGSDRLHRSGPAWQTVRIACTAAVPSAPQRYRAANGTHRSHRSGPDPDVRFASRAPQRSRAANGTHRVHRSGPARRTVRITCTATVRRGERYAPPALQRYGAANGTHRLHRSGAAFLS